MRTIKEAYPNVKEILGVQLPAKQKKYRRNRYILSCKEDGGELQYNILTGELILMDPDYTYSEKETLIQKWFLVPEDCDEFLLAKKLKGIYRDKGAIKNGRNSYTIFTTTECNARCFYCYEKHVKRETMTLETAVKVADFMMSHRGERPISVTWFGGEPLCNTAVIDAICEYLQAENQPYSSEMITNAYLFDEETVRKAVELWKLQIVRVTIDGTNDLYRRVKNYINEDPDPLERVIDNLHALIHNHIKVQIRMHVDYHSLENTEDLIQRVVKEFGHHPLVTAYVHMLYENHDNSLIHHTDEERMEIMARCFELEEILSKNRLLHYGLREKPMVYACLADCDNVLAVLPDGSLLKCRDYLDLPPVGSVSNNELDIGRMEEWKIRADDFEQCRFCRVYPECGRLKLCKEREQCSPSKIMKKEHDMLCAMACCYTQYKTDRME